MSLLDYVIGFGLECANIYWITDHHQSCFKGFGWPLSFFSPVKVEGTLYKLIFKSLFKTTFSSLHDLQFRKMASGQCMCKVSKIVLGDLKRKEKSVYD